MPVPGGNDVTTTTYATLDDLKASLTLTANDRDDRLTRTLIAASRSIDKACGRRFWLDDSPSPRTYRLLGQVATTDEDEQLLVDDIGALDGLSVSIGSGGTFVDIDDYLTGPDNAVDKGEPVTYLSRARGTWLRHRGHGQRVQVTARWGFPAIPDEIAEATLMLANRLYKRKDSPEGVLGSAEWGVVRVSRTDPDVTAMIQPYVLFGMA